MSSFELLMVGDVNCKLDGVLAAEPLSRVATILDGADIRLGNLEGAFGDPAVELDYKPGWHHCEPEAIDLIRGRFDAVACANNVHHGDAIATSMALLDATGIRHTGAGASIRAARTPAVVEHEGRRVGVLAFSAIFWPIGHAAQDDAPGISAVKAITAYQPHPRIVEMPGAPAIVHSYPSPEDAETVRASIAALREEVDVVVVYFHWGVTAQDEITEYQQILGRLAIDAGANIVAGSHPHIPQGIELYGGGAILYSLGNFMFGWRLHQHLTKDGLLARVEVHDDAPWELTVIPITRSDDGHVFSPEPGSAESRRIMDRVTVLADRFGTDLVLDGDRFRARSRIGAVIEPTPVARR